METTREYHCTICGKRMRPTVLWQCVEENEALQRGETVTVDHQHIPRAKPVKHVPLSFDPDDYPVY